ncbi:MAG: enoyl-CoA hydratase/isomerase family protein [Burkholderiales bacterium]|nr:enoyl-CoA hydratase/isomerase family protein [Burkholderiales bacterium]
MTTDVSLDALGDGIFLIRLDRPERMNALGVATCAALEQRASEASAQRARVVIVGGSGRAFCAGADLKERKGMDLAARLAHNGAIRGAIDALANARFVTIAMLNGVALGGGLELAIGCDFRIAASGITVGLTESRVGAFPGAGGTQRLPRLIGVSRALQMMLTGEPVTSEYAFSIGLVNEVVAPDKLEPRVKDLAAMLATRSAPALAAIKRLVYTGIELPLAAALQLERAALPEMLGSADYAEGLAAFAERRQPRFTETLR